MTYFTKIVKGLKSQCFRVSHNLIMTVLVPVTNDDYVGMYSAETPGKSLLANKEAATRGVL